LADSYSFKGGLIMTVCIEQRQQRIQIKRWPLTLIFIAQAAITGLLFSQVSWTWLFCANVLIGALVLSLHAVRTHKVRHGGMASWLAALTVLSVLVALTCWSQRGVGDDWTHLSNGVAASLVLLFLLHQKYASRPWFPRGAGQQTQLSWGLAAETFSIAGLGAGLFLAMVLLPRIDAQTSGLSDLSVGFLLTLLVAANRLSAKIKGRDAVATLPAFTLLAPTLQAAGVATGIALTVVFLAFYPDGKGYAGISVMLVVLALSAAAAGLVAADAWAE